LAEPSLRLDSVTKRFGAVAAVREASLSVVPGRLHAVVGENGAGKSTLLGMAGGVHAPDGGAVLVGGSLLVPCTPAEAARRGVGFVHQHFMLIEAFTCLENIVLGAEPVIGPGLLEPSLARQKLRDVLRDAGLEVELDARVETLGVGERQTLEIVRVLYRGARTILLDEPTAVLTPAQADSLFGTLRRLASDGAGIVVVTHRLSEVMRWCDDVTVMRRGRVVSSTPVAQSSEEELTRAIMGREPPPPIVRPEVPADAKLRLRTDKLSVAGQRDGRLAIEDVSLEVRGGEIVGVAGVEGNGQTELVQALAGLIAPKSGRIELDGRELGGLGVRERRNAGLAVVHGDRHRDGLMLDATVWDNLVIGDLGEVNEPEAVARRIDSFGVVPSDPMRLARELSGGNQQKIVTARALDRKIAAVVLAQPTRGVDLGAARTIHEAILQAVRSGAAAVVVSADLAELRAICHRILVIARGRIVATLPPDAPEQDFGKAMLGLQASQEGT